MHAFDKLIEHCTEFSLRALGEAQQRVIEALDTSGPTGLVKALQMLQLQHAISAVGMFSMFDASLQSALNCADGFRDAKKLLDDNGEVALSRRFMDFQLAVNVLKHGDGRSYEALVARAGALPFRVLLPHESFFDEGDVGEVSTLVEADDKFVRGCAATVREVASALQRLKPGIVF